MARAPKATFTLIKVDKNLIDAEWKFFTLTQRKMFWYIAKRMQELGYVRGSLEINSIMTPQMTKVMNLSTGAIEESYASKVAFFKVDLGHLYKETSITFEQVKEAVDKFQKTTLKFKDKERKKETFCSVIPRAEFSIDRKEIEIHIYAELVQFLLELQEYITMNLNKILSFKSQYTLRFYELLNKVKNQDYPEFRLTLESANKMFDTKYLRLKDIERYILIPAQKELKEKSNISFEYLPILALNGSEKGGRRPITAFKIMCTKNIAQPTLF